MVYCASGVPSTFHALRSLYASHAFRDVSCTPPGRYGAASGAWPLRTPLSTRLHSSGTFLTNATQFLEKVILATSWSAGRSPGARAPSAV